MAAHSTHILSAKPQAIRDAAIRRSSTHLNSRERHAVAQVDFELVNTFFGAGEASIIYSD
jgi:hypothetical protein